MNTKHIRVEDIMFDVNTQIREKTKPDLVRRYRQAMAEYDPSGNTVVGFKAIQVAEAQAKGAKKVYTIIDGWHRATAALELGKELIEAEIITVSGTEELLWLASRANLLHGEKLSNKEKRMAFRNYLKAKQHRHPGPRGGRANGKIKSAREMAIDLGGIAHKTVLKWLKADAPMTYQQLQRERTEEFAEAPDEPFDGPYNPDARHRDAAIGLLQEAALRARAVKGRDDLQAILTELNEFEKEITKRLPAIADDF
ncbi:hypothetical protein [Mesorhizobium sp. ESP-6-2]|uniref:hypothetical protein n=1 Tax=Mesorhizobium sp. ESP-6-2 TaxID=2876625 RepID=UPI001CCE43C4|nr:hypothetical protein [Mesorhizobium sp. ESP-6-2]MBZ9806952.1 hypothetical protein [Mesorhizobium sp. ESP-6-2]